LIGPGFRVITLWLEIVIVPPETLLIAAPPSPAPLPVKVEFLISTRPKGRSARFSGSTAHS
jgi:hypothetical protein